jgi:hypothetical protein
MRNQKKAEEMAAQWFQLIAPLLADGMDTAKTKQLRKSIWKQLGYFFHKMKPISGYVMMSGIYNKYFLPNIELVFLMNSISIKTQLLQIRPIKDLKKLRIIVPLILSPLVYDLYKLLLLIDCGGCSIHPRSIKSLSPSPPYFIISVIKRE